MPEPITAEQRAGYLAAYAARRIDPAWDVLTRTGGIAPSLSVAEWVLAADRGNGDPDIEHGAGDRDRARHGWPKRAGG